MLNLDSAIGVGVVIGVESQESRRLQVINQWMIRILNRIVLTSGTEGTVKFGTPFAKLPNPASDPQAESENSSFSTRA